MDTGHVEAFGNQIAACQDVDATGAEVSDHGTPHVPIHAAVNTHCAIARVPELRGNVHRVFDTDAERHGGQSIGESLVVADHIPGDGWLVGPLRQLAAQEVTAALVHTGRVDARRGEYAVISQCANVDQLPHGRALHHDIEGLVQPFTRQSVRGRRHPEDKRAGIRAHDAATG